MKNRSWLYFRDFREDLKSKRTVLQITSAFLLVFTIIHFHIDVAHASSFDEAWKEFMKEYRVIVAGVCGFGALTSILVFIYHFIRLGAMPSHPIQRHEVMTNMLISAICTALLGGMTLILTIFYGVIFEPTKNSEETAYYMETNRFIEEDDLPIVYLPEEGEIIHHPLENHL